MDFAIEKGAQCSISKSRYTNILDLIQYILDHYKCQFVIYVIYIYIYIYIYVSVSLVD